MLFQNSPVLNGWKPTALVIDRDADIHRSIHVMLGKEFDVHHAYFPRLAVSLLEKQRFNVVITSLDMTANGENPQLDHAVERISESKGIPVIGLTEEGTSDTTGNVRCVGKPLDENVLESALRQALNGITRRRHATTVSAQ
jgi:DNA-binding NtrC family response regulator